MAYYGVQEPENVRARIRSPRGETFDLSIPASCTVGDLRVFLLNEYNYAPSMRLGYNGRQAPDNALVTDYPFGALLIMAGDDQGGLDSLPARSAAPAAHNNGSGRHGAGESTTSQLPPRQAQPAASRTVGSGVSTPQQQQQPAFQHRPTYPTQAMPPPPPTNRRTASPPLPSPVVPARRQKGAPLQTPDSRGATTSPAPPAAVPRERSREGSGHSGRAPPSPSAKGLRASQEGVADGGSSGGHQAPTMNRSLGSNTDVTANDNLRGSRGTPLPEQAQGPAASGAAGSNTATAANDEVNDERPPWQLAMFTVECVIPALDKSVALQVNGDASVADLVLTVVATIPEVAGGVQVVHHGRVLPQTPQSRLFDFGIRTDTRVYIASGEYANPNTIVLREIEDEIRQIAHAIQRPLTELERKGYYENLMRILFRTDGLMELEGEWRQRRKTAVAEIKRLQDIVHPEGD